MNQYNHFAVAEHVRKHIELILPDEARRLSHLSFFADSMERLHTHGPGNWSTYCEGPHMRLVAGGYIVLTVQDKKLWLALDQASIESSSLNQGGLERIRGVKLDTGRWAHYKHRGKESTLTTNVFYSPTLEDAEGREVQDLHFALLDRVVRGALRPASREKHQPAVSACLQLLLGRSLPQPTYCAETNPTQQPTERLRDEGEVLVEPFDPADERDGRHRVSASLVSRRGQGAFRDDLMRAYEGKCAMTGWAVAEVLEAAHILPYRGEHTNHVSNGLLLRSDMHVLFDLHLIEVDAESFTLLVNSKLANTPYGMMHGWRLRLPCDPRLRPLPECFRRRLTQT